MAEGAIKRQIFSRIISYTGTTDSKGNLEIPNTIVNALTTWAILAFSVGGYGSTLIVSSSKYAVHFSNYDGTSLGNTNVTVYLAV